MFARRLAPRAGVVMEDGAALTWRPGSGWVADGGCLRMQDDGTLAPFALKGVAA
jgi:hypothetical protein